MTTKITSPAEAELDRKIKLLMQTSGRSYTDAMTTVLLLDDGLKRRWIDETLGRAEMSTLLIEVSAVAELTAELDALQGQDGNLSHKAACMECKRYGAKDNEADRVLKELEGGPERELLRGAFRRLTACVRNFARTSVLRPERMGSYLGESAEALGRMQVGRASLMLAVIKTLGKEESLWGEQENPQALGLSISKLKSEIEEGHDRIRSSITLGDLTIHENLSSQDRENGMSRITVRMTGDLVALGDGRDLPERLVGWWTQNDGTKKRAA